MNLTIQRLLEAPEEPVKIEASGGSLIKVVRAAMQLGLEPRHLFSSEDVEESMVEPGGMLIYHDSPEAYDPGKPPSSIWVHPDDAPKVMKLIKEDPILFLTAPTICAQIRREGGIPGINSIRLTDNTPKPGFMQVSWDSIWVHPSDKIAVSRHIDRMEKVLELMSNRAGEMVANAIENRRGEGVIDLTKEIIAMRHRGDLAQGQFVDMNMVLDAVQSHGWIAAAPTHSGFKVCTNTPYDD